MIKTVALLGLLIVSVSSLGQDIGVRLDSLFKSKCKNTDPGLSAIVLSQGKIAFRKSYGLANLRTKIPNNPLTNFNIGSMTKQFTAFAILQLWKEQKLALDDKLIKFFPDFNPKTGNVISIQELLTHSSGILDHYAFIDTVSIKHATDKAVLEAVRDEDTTYFTPGTQFRYSNTGYCLLALVVEKLSGLSYSEYLKKNIFKPLAMHESTVFKFGDDIFQKAMGYDYDSAIKKFRQDDATESIFFSTEGDGGIYTSVDDYLKWYQALSEGKIVDKSLVQKARSAEFPVDPSKGLSYGFGWFVQQNDSTTQLFHFGSNAGFQSVVFTIPSQNYGVIIFSNRADLDINSLVKEVNRIFHIPDNSAPKSN
jgi:D-alanyl-D-alanine carboxypeptidase